VLTEQQESLRSDLLIAGLHLRTASCHQTAGPEYTSTIRHLHASGNPSTCFMQLRDGMTSLLVAAGVGWSPVIHACSMTLTAREAVRRRSRQAEWRQIVCHAAPRNRSA